MLFFLHVIYFYIRSLQPEFKFKVQSSQGDSHCDRSRRRGEESQSSKKRRLLASCRATNYDVLDYFIIPGMDFLFYRQHSHTTHPWYEKTVEIHSHEINN